MANEKMVNKAMKKMYIEPKIDIVSFEAAMSICRVSGDGRVKVNNDTPPFNGKVI